MDASENRKVKLFDYTSITYETHGDYLEMWFDRWLVNKLMEYRSMLGWTCGNDITDSRGDKDVERLEIAKEIGHLYGIFIMNNLTPRFLDIEYKFYSGQEVDWYLDELMRHYLKVSNLGPDNAGMFRRSDREQKYILISWMKLNYKKGKGKVWRFTYEKNE